MCEDLSEPQQRCLAILAGHVVDRPVMGKAIAKLGKLSETCVPLVVAAVLQVITLVGSALTTYLTDRVGPSARWILPPVLSVALAVVLAAAQQLMPGGPAAERVGPPRGVSPTGSSLRSSSWVSGVGRRAVGVRHVAGYITGKESGIPRLVTPVSGRSGGLTLRVEKVENTAHFTRVELLGTNRGATTVTLPLFGNCVLSSTDGTTLEADPFRSEWAESIAPGATRRGTVILVGHLPDAGTRAAFSCGTVFGPGGGGSMTVRGIRLSRS